MASRFGRVICASARCDLCTRLFSLTQMEFNLTVLAAVLAILGYSLNDSIIIADRIRELLIVKPKLAIKEINSQAVVATFSRTMVTSGTTLLTLGALWIWSRPVGRLFDYYVYRYLYWHFLIYFSRYLII